MARLLKAYRLMKGTFWAPNPSFKEGSDEPSHVQLNPGEIVHLNDDQYKSFKDRFAPADSDASDVKSEDEEELEVAKVTAAVTGQNVNPNAKAQPGPKATVTTPRQVSA